MNNYGASCSRHGSYRLALAAYSRIPEHDLTATTYYNRGLAYYYLKRFAAAEAAFRRAIRSRKNFAEAWNNLGLALYGQRRFREAAKAMQWAIRVNQRSYRAWNNLGATYLRLGRRRAAVAAFRTALEINSSYGVARRNLRRIVALFHSRTARLSDRRP